MKHFCVQRTKLCKRGRVGVGCLGGVPPAAIPIGVIDSNLRTMFFTFGAAELELMPMSSLKHVSE